jgi:hypothetical protein
MKDFDKTMCKVRFATEVFVGGFTSAITDKSAMAWSAGIGLYQGLKYNGNLKNGIQGGIATAVTIGVMGGLYAVHDKWNSIKEYETVQELS